jgi:hypothetical protein
MFYNNQPNAQYVFIIIINIKIILKRHYVFGWLL